MANLRTAWVVFRLMILAVGALTLGAPKSVQATCATCTCISGCDGGIPTVGCVNATSTGWTGCAGGGYGSTCYLYGGRCEPGPS